MPGSLAVREVFRPADGQINTISSEIVCEGQDITLTAAFSGNPTDYVWSFPTQLREVSRNANTITLHAEESGVVELSALARNQCGDGTEAFTQLTLLDNPTVSIDAIPRVFINEPALFSFTSDASIVTVDWLFSDGQQFSTTSPTVLFTEGGAYSVNLEVINIAGCAGKDRQEFTIQTGEVGNFSIKNMVTLNGDGLNDYLIIEDIDRFPESEVLMYDRWGNIVFQRKGYQNDWDFKRGADYLPAGCYVCVIRSDGKLYSRTVTLIKGF